MANKIVVRDRACKQCGKRPITGYSFCSNECRWQSDYVARKGRGFLESNRERNRLAAHRWLDRHYGPKPEGLKRRKRITPHPCEVCGKQTQRPKCCSTKCLAKTAVAKEAQHRAGAARRARMRGATVERVDRLKVFERDGWICHLCGRKTHKGKLGTNNKLAPELDHIVPLVKGGEHSYANTACACKSCNARKGARILGQPSLLAA